MYVEGANEQECDIWRNFIPIFRMQYIIQPARPPPDPRTIMGLSPDAEVVWKHLRQVAQRNNTKKTLGKFVKQNR